MGYTPLDIPEFKPLDLSGLPGIADSYFDARKKKDEHEKLSAEMARQAWQDAHSYAKEQSEQLKPGSDFWRAAQMSAGLGNAVGAPYGLSAAEETGKAMAPDNASPSAADTAAFLKNGGLSLEKGEKDPLLGADVSGHPAAGGEYQPLQGPTPTGEPLHTQDTGAPVTPQSPLDAESEFAKRDAAIPTTRHVYAQVNGQRFEAPKEAPTSIFPEPEYNAMVDKLVATGKFDDAAAIKQVEAVRKADIGEGGKNTRLGQVLGFRGEHTMTAEEQQALAEGRIGQSDTNNRRMTGAMIEAAGIRSGSGGPIGDPKLINAYNSYSKAAQASALMKQDQQGQRMFDRIAAELDPDNPNPLNHQMANHSLAAISVSTGGGAGRVPVSVIHDVQNAYSMATSAKNWLYKQAHGGQNSPEVVTIMRDAQAKLLQLSQSERENDYQVWNHKAGHASPWAQDPKTRPLVDAEAESVRAQLHLPPLSASPPETPYLPAPAEQQPATAHRTRGPAPAPAASGGGEPIGTKRPDKNGHMREKTAKGWVLVQ